MNEVVGRSQSGTESQTGNEIRDRLTKQSLTLSRWLCVPAAAIPLLAAAGWIFSIEFLIRIHPAFPAMQPNTALVLLLGALAITFTPDQRQAGKSHLVAWALAPVVLLLGLLTLGEYIFSWDLGIDRILAGASAAGRLYPGRPSPQTAANFAALGFALLIYNLRFLPIRLGQFCALVTGANAVVAMTGYIFSTGQFYGFPAIESDIGMAVHTATSFTLMAVALLFRRPNDGFMSLVTSDTRSGGMARRILLAGVLAPPLVGALTRIGVHAGWYDTSVQVSLFAVVIVSLVLQATWRAARQSEHDELRARAALERLDLALRGADLAIWDWNIQTGEVIFNRRWAEMRGFRPEEIKPHVDSWRSGVHPDDWPKVQEALTKYFDGLVPEYQAEFRALTKSGGWMWILDRGKVFTRDDNGQPHRMAGTELDITERKRLEHEQEFLAEVGAVLGSTLSYEDTLRNIAQLAVRDLADFCIVDVIEEDGGSRRLKVASRDPSLTPVCDLFMGVTLEQSHPSLVTSVLKDRRTALFEFHSPESVESFSQSEESRRALSGADPGFLIATPLLAHGKPLGVITLISSSKSRVYGTPDFRLAEELAQRAALSIENARLFGEAQRAIKTREEVLAVVSHDLGNSLAAIELTVQLCRKFERIDANQIREFADRVHASTSEMHALIADLLDFARIQSGTFSIVASARSLSQVVIPVIDGIRPLAEANQQTLEVNLPSSLPPVAVDVRRVRQVVSNLLRNAIKFTPREGTIRVSACKEDRRIVVLVSDTGPGIPQEHLSKIFDRFWRLPGTEQPGSGLGLSIAKGIVEAHGGRIWAESQLGKGSSIFFTLPQADSETRPADSAA